jgi:hypothetical protein
MPPFENPVQAVSIEIPIVTIFPNPSLERGLERFIFSFYGPFIP